MRTFIICARKDNDTVSVIIPLTNIQTPAEFKIEFPMHQNGKIFFQHDLGLYVNLCATLPAEELKSLKKARNYLSKNSAQGAVSFIYFEDLHQWYFSESLSDPMLEII